MGGRLGFSTGALEKGDYGSAVSWSRENHLNCVELSALRLSELEPLVDNLERLDLSGFGYVSFHAPSAFTPTDELKVVQLLECVRVRHWNLVVHPDVIFTPSLWRRFGRQLLVENMDRRKRTGRTVEEMNQVLKQLPEARVCLDVAHARQLDTTLTLLADLCRAFASRIAEVHLSELDSRCGHRSMSRQSVIDYAQFLPSLPAVPIIIESMLFGREPADRLSELQRAKQLARR